MRVADLNQWYGQGCEPKVRSGGLTGLLVLGLIWSAQGLWAGPAMSQDAGPGAAAAKAAQGAAGQAKPKAASGDAELRRRVEQLEEQLVDLQVVIGTLESLARSGGGGAMAAPRQPVAAGLSPADAGRIEALEMQIKALASQISQLSGSSQGGSGQVGAAPSYPPAADRFGSTTVNSANLDEIGGLISEPEFGNGASGSGWSATPPASERVSPAPPAGASGGAVAAIDPGLASGDPKQDYERAYAFLLQQNYGAAQSGFTEFLRAYPKDSLVPNALYWLGETHYVQRNYADAAEAFDLVMQGFGNSPKAPDSMLKRSMALASIGKTQDACGLLRQLPTKYPSAPAHLKGRADSERQRLGCG